jgi:hypothetical protein
MATPGKPRTTSRHREWPVQPLRRNTVWRCLECLAGAGIAVVAVLLGLPLLVELTQPLHLLATTALAAILIFVWIFAWAVIATARERLSAAIG